MARRVLLVRGARRARTHARRPRDLRRGRLVVGEARRGDRPARARPRRVHGRRATSAAPPGWRSRCPGTTRDAARSRSSNGWLATAERLLENLPEAPEHGASPDHARAHGAFRRGRLRARGDAVRERLRAGSAGRRPGPPDPRALREGTHAHPDGSGRGGTRHPRRGDGVRGGRRSRSALDGPRLLHDHQLVPRPGRLPTRRRVDRGREQVVRQARRHRLPGRVSHPPRRGHAVPR